MSSMTTVTAMARTAVKVVALSSMMSKSTSTASTPQIVCWSMTFETDSMPNGWRTSTKNETAPSAAGVVPTTPAIEFCELIAESNRS